MPLSESARRDWLRLARTENIGPVTFRNLIARFGTASAALAEVPRMASRGGAKNFVLPDESAIAQEIEALAKLGGRMIASSEPDYPRGLAALEAPPPILSVLGHPHLLQKEMIAMVGARNASALARKFADTLARDLGFAGIVVVSGLARGIDAAAHEAALAVGTVAVVAGGVDIISGLARGVVVVEAAEKSGSLITAQYAIDQGREVFAVPGSPLDPRARGANRLIREGAVLTEGADDILSVLTPMLGGGFAEPDAPSPAMPAAGLEAEADRIRARVEEALGPAPVAIDELIRQTGAPVAAILTVLLELELAGRCVRHPGNRVSWA